ncbi:MAG: hypothetical protein JNN05_05690 [Candidatus Omnitrophica bacterium]|nr:hypothetical protein [Candidatus Omnitrophota bacterium]
MVDPYGLQMVGMVSMGEANLAQNSVPFPATPVMPVIPLPSGSPMQGIPEQPINQTPNGSSNVPERGRGQQDPVGGKKPVNPGRDSEGNCNACPENEYWNVNSPGHGCEEHWHGIEWNQDPSTCICFPRRVSGKGSK